MILAVVHGHCWCNGSLRGPTSQYSHAHDSLYSFRLCM